jgi:hypothetical protein
MPFFHLMLKPDGMLISDEEPEEFTGLEDARSEATESLRELAANAIRDGRAFNYTGIEITDQKGEKLAEILATEAVPQLRRH